MATTREPPAVAAWYEMMLWALPVMGRLPRSHRYTLGEVAERRRSARRRPRRCAGNGR